MIAKLTTRLCLSSKVVRSCGEMMPIRIKGVDHASCCQATEQSLNSLNDDPF